MLNQQVKELITAQKMSDEHNNKDLNHVPYISPHIAVYKLHILRT